MPRSEQARAMRGPTYGRWRLAKRLKPLPSPTGQWFAQETGDQIRHNVEQLRTRVFTLR